MGGGGSSKTTTTTAAPKYLQPYLEQYAGRASELANLPYQGYQGPRIAPTAPETSAGFGQIINRAMYGDPNTNAASNLAQATMQGQGFQRTANNPYLGAQTQVGQNSFLGATNPFTGQTNPYGGETNQLAGATNQYTGQTNQYAGASNPFAFASNPFATATNRFTNISNPLIGENPYLNQAVQRSQDDVVNNFQRAVAPQTATMANFGNAFGGSAHQQLMERDNQNLMRSLGDVSSQMRGADYSNSQQLLAQDLARRSGLAGEDLNRISSNINTDIGRMGSIYGQDLSRNVGVSEADLSRNAGLASTDLARNAGLYGQDLSRNTATAESDLARNAGLASTDLARNASLADAGLARQSQYSNADLSRNAGIAQQDIQNSQQAYEAERARQMQAMMFSPQLAQQNTANTQALLGVGDYQNRLAQQALDQAYQQFQQQQQYPYQQLDFLGSSLGRAMTGQGSVTAPNPNQGSGLANTLGTGASILGALGMGNPIAAAGTGIFDILTGGGFRA